MALTPPPVVHFKDCRDMGELSDRSALLVVTSPPYWCIKDYGHPTQISAAVAAGRQFVGYELNPAFSQSIQAKIDLGHWGAHNSPEDRHHT